MIDLDTVTDLDSTVGRLLAATDALVARLHADDDGASRRVGARLSTGVLRPLRSTNQPGTRPARDPDEPDRAPDVILWDLARAATTLWCERPERVELCEAVATLQELAVEAADPQVRADRLAELSALQSGTGQRILAVPGGPYLVTNVESLVDHLGVPMATRPTFALCRCGQSETTPSCDGACVATGFTTGKDPHRVADHQDAYVGQSVTVLDNRGICQHSGLCTDRLASVFHAGTEPFVTPSGGRLDEIVRAVRDCPSGALSFALDGIEAREQVDHGNRRQSAIEVTRDGPYRVTGGIPLVDTGGDVTPAEGSSREHYTLCRCGHSQNKPFCSGMHWYVGFRDPEPDPNHTPTVFEWCGGLPALTRMTRLFYEKYVPQDPMLGPIFATMSPDHPQRVAAWLGEVFGGPTTYSDTYGGYPRMITQHVGKCLTQEWRARWVELMTRSAAEAGLPDDPEFQSAFSSYLEWGSRLAVENSQTTSRPPMHMPMPHWDWTTGAGAPGSRISALAPPEPQEESAVVEPAADEAVEFDKHIKGLFRAQDRRAMTFAFDLWSYDDVRTHADAILQQVQEGSMPCDQAWSDAQVATFSRWVDGGMPA